MKRISIIFILFLFFISCNNYLDEKEVKFIPYKKGQILIFENENKNVIDTITISSIDKFIPDGPQINFNEILRINDKNGNYIVYLSAGYGKNSDTYLKINGLNGKHYLKDLELLQSSKINLNGIIFNDVIIIKRKSDIGNIDKVYWSKKNGIVMYITKDKTTWKLKK